MPPTQSRPLCRPTINSQPTGEERPWTSFCTLPLGLAAVPPLGFVSSTILLILAIAVPVLGVVMVVVLAMALNRRRDRSTCGGP
jgi:hypothetical protein